MESNNTSIFRAKNEDSRLLADIGKTSFLESHGNSAAVKDIDQYVKEQYNENVFKKELSDPKNNYYIIYHDKRAAGYSKIIFSAAHSNIPVKNATKLERLYLLKEFYDLKLGYELFKFNVGLSKSNDQSGMWLFVWKENKRAVDFYEKMGFKVIGSCDFNLTETHSNPNYQMFLKYQETLSCL